LGRARIVEEERDDHPARVCGCGHAPSSRRLTMRRGRANETTRRGREGIPNAQSGCCTRETDCRPSLRESHSSVALDSRLCSSSLVALASPSLTPSLQAALSYIQSRPPHFATLLLSASPISSPHQHQLKEGLSGGSFFMHLTPSFQLPAPSRPPQSRSPYSPAAAALSHRLSVAPPLTSSRLIPQLWPARRLSQKKNFGKAAASSEPAAT
jgi:hypothetical protein